MSSFLETAPDAGNQAMDGKVVVKVPLANLEEDGTSPEVGDSVNFDIEGTIQSIDGDIAVVKPDKIDGEDVAESEGGNEPEQEQGEMSDEGEDGGDHLRSLMQAFDQSRGYGS